LQNNAVGAVCPSVIVTLYFDSHSSLPVHFAPQQSAHFQVHSWHFLLFLFHAPLSLLFLFFQLFNPFNPSIQVSTTFSTSLSLNLSMDAKPPQLAAQPFNYQVLLLLPTTLPQSKDSQ